MVAVLELLLSTLCDCLSAVAAVLGISSDTL